MYHRHIKNMHVKYSYTSGNCDVYHSANKGDYCGVKEKDLLYFYGELRTSVDGEVVVREDSADDEEHGGFCVGKAWRGYILYKFRQHELDSYPEYDEEI